MTGWAGALPAPQRGGTMPETTAAPDVAALVVGVLGGTGPQGKGLAYRLAAAGQQVIVGSRDAGRAATAAAELNELPGIAAPIAGEDNAGAASKADIVIVA